MARNETINSLEVQAFLLIDNYQKRCRRRRAMLLLHANALLSQNRRIGRPWRFQRSGHWWSCIVPSFNDSQWLTHFRLNREAFQSLCNEVWEDIKPDDLTVRQPIPTKKRAAIALFKLASSAEYRTVAELFGVSPSSIHNCLKWFCFALCKKIKKYISLPTLQKAVETAARIEKNHHFPQVFGCIDGTHIAVTAPSTGKKDYTNRKGWDSLILQAVVDDSGRFIDISVKMPGSCHDATVFKESGLFKNSSNLPKAPVVIEGVECPLMILGDPAYPLLPWLLKPFVGTSLSPDKESFNCYHSSVRIAVEHAFGRLKARWRTMGKKIDADIKIAPNIIAACCVLHNICEESNIPIPANTQQSQSTLITQPICTPCTTETSSGVACRTALLQHITNNLPQRQSSRYL